jgi:hypothetical protein
MALPVKMASCFVVPEYCSIGALQNIKLPNIKSQNFRCQVSGVRFQGGKAKALSPEH